MICFSVDLFIALYLYTIPFIPPVNNTNIKGIKNSRFDLESCRILQEFLSKIFEFLVKVAESKGIHR